MFDEQTEFAISQYADGSLPSADRAALEQRLAADPALRELLAEYRALDAALTHLPDVPPIAWDRLADQISNAIAEEDNAGHEPITLPVGNWAMPWVRRAAGLAVAACVLIAVGIGLRDRFTAPAHSNLARGTLIIAGPSPETPVAEAKVVQEITIGPAPSLAINADGFSYGDSGVVTHRQRVVIASEDAPAQDSTATPY